MTARRPSQILLSVIIALFLRELNTKMSVGKLGLFWTFFEPFMQVTMFILIRVANKINSKHYTAIVTYRNVNIRIISVRRSREKEIETYDKFRIR